MKIYAVLLITILMTSSAISSDVETSLKFENPLRDCKTYVPQDGDREAVFSNISALKIKQHEENNEVFADLKMSIAFGKCVDGKWLRYVGTPLIVKGVVQRSLFNKKKFALKATFEAVDTVSDGRTDNYSPSLVIGLNVSVSQIKKLLKSSDKIEVIARYELLGAIGNIYARYIFKQSANGELTFLMNVF